MKTPFKITYAIQAIIHHLYISLRLKCKSNILICRHRFMKRRANKNGQSSESDCPFLNYGLGGPPAGIHTS